MEEKASSFSYENILPLYSASNLLYESSLLQIKNNTANAAEKLLALLTNYDYDYIFDLILLLAMTSYFVYRKNL